MLDLFINSFINAAKRGVAVYLLFDHYGSSEISTNDRQRLLAAGISLHFYNPFRWSSLYRSIKRNHRKLLLIDDRIVFVGGAGITDDYRFDRHENRQWHDTVIRIEGEAITDWEQLFVDLWKKEVDKNYTRSSAAPTQRGEMIGRVAAAAGPGRNQVTRHAITHIRKSQDRIWITTPYFLVTRKLRRALKSAARRGVDVRLLLPGHISDHEWVSHAARRYYTRLLKNKVSIYEYQPRFIHAKLILCDNWVSIGSSNFDRWNHHWNLDANQEVFDAEFAVRVAHLFQQDFEASRLLDIKTWRQRSMYQRWREWWYGYQVRLIQWLSFFVSRK